MHIHPSAIGQQPINTSAAGSERAAAAQKAVETRKRLLKSAQSIDATDSDPEATFLVGKWLDSRHSQLLPADSYRAASEGDDPDFA